MAMWHTQLHPLANGTLQLTATRTIVYISLMFACRIDNEKVVVENITPKQAPV